MGWFGATSQNNYAEISYYLFLIIPQRNPGLAQHPGLPVKHFMRDQLNISEKLHETLKPEAYQFARIQVAIRARDPKLALRPQLQEARTAPHSLELTVWSFDCSGFVHKTRHSTAGPGVKRANCQGNVTCSHQCAEPKQGRTAESRVNPKKLETR